MPLERQILLKFMISINNQPTINHYRGLLSEAKSSPALLKGLSNNELVDVTYNRLFINKKPVNFTGTDEKQLISNLTMKLEKNNAPVELRKGLPLLATTLYRAVKEFEQANKIDFKEAIKVANQLDKALEDETLHSLNEYLSAIEPECLDRSRNLPSDEAVNGVMMQLEFSKNYKTKTPPEELSNAFNLFYCRKVLKDHTVSLLNRYKNIETLKPYRKEIDAIAKELDKKLLCLGLSPEVKDIVQKAQVNLGTQLKIHDAPLLANLIYQRLEYFKNLGRPVVDILDVNDFDHSYGTGVYSKLCQQNLSASSIKYCSDNDLIDKRHISLNPQDLLKMMNTAEEEKVSSLITHEHGHLWHNEKVGDKVYYNPDMQLKYTHLLTSEEKELFNQYKNIVVGVVPGLESIFSNLATVVNRFDEIHTDLRFKLKFDDKLTDEMVNKLSSVIKKFETACSIIDELPDAYAKKYAKTSPGELVACAVEWSDRASYSKDFIELLAKFDAPSLLPSAK